MATYERQNKRYPLILKEMHKKERRKTRQNANRTAPDKDSKGAELDFNYRLAVAAHRKPERGAHDARLCKR